MPLLAALTSGLLAVSAVTAGAQLREETNRQPVFAARKSDATALAYVPVRVGEERRLSLADGGRVQLALRPVQASANGRMFLYTRIPAELSEPSFPAEFLVWRSGAWERHRVLEKKSGELGYLSTTLTLPNVGAGPVPTAVFRRVTEHGQLQSIVSTTLEIPSGARLKVGFSLDEWDWEGLSPVEVTVTAVITDKKSPEGREVRVFRQRIDPQGTEPQWFDAVVDLSPARGKNVRFIFRAEPLYAKGRLAPHVVWSAPAIVTGKPHKRMQSVVMVLLDGIRAQSLGCYGGAKDVSPFLDRLFAQEGAVFERAITQAVETTPAHMTVLTGVYPCAHQVYTARQTLAAEIVPFTQIMAAGGYATAAFTDSAGFAAEIGFGRGFDAFYQDAGLDLWESEGGARGVFARAAAWAEAHSDEPFLLVVHTRQAAPPYVPPREIHNRTGGDDPPIGTLPMGGEDRVRYEQEIRYLDGLMREFVEAIDAASEPERTLMMVTSAHGEEFLEHGALEHGANLYDESIRVPLLIRGAGIRGKRRYAEIVGLVDVAPTVLELTGFDALAQMQGTSLAVALRKGKPPQTGPRFSEAHSTRRKLANGDDGGWRPPAFAVSDSKHKLIEFVVQERRILEAYDIGAEPSEKADLLQSVAGQPPWLGGLRVALESYAVECRRAARPPTKTEMLPVSTLFKLKAFGYL